MDKRIKILTFILLMCMLWLPLAQKKIKFFKELPLNGAYEVPTNPKISVSTWLEGSFQKQKEDYENFKFGFRGLLVKLKNSLNYTLFKDIAPSDQIEGRNGFIYAKGSVDRYFGTVYNGREKNDSTVIKINFFKNAIESRGGHFLTVIAPSKESIFPENLPYQYHNVVKSHNDYDDLVQGYNRYKIPYIDFYTYFNKLKYTCAYPLFTKTGFHWSMYASSLAQDSILKYIQYYFSKEMPKCVETGVEWTRMPRGSDADFEEPMNLLFDIHEPQYVYPNLEILPITLNHYRPKAIIIGDSFFRQIQDLKMLSNLFSDNSKFWFYFSRSLPLTDSDGPKINNIDVMKELETANIVILFGNMGNMDKFPFGVTDFYYDASQKIGIIDALNNFLTTDLNLMSISAAHSIVGRDSTRMIAERIFNARKYFKIRSSDNKYVCADGSKNGLLFADRPQAYEWETFQFFQLDADTYVISSYQNKFVTVESTVENKIMAVGNQIGDWEKIKIIKLVGNNVAFKAMNHKYLGWDKKSRQLFAKRYSAGREERFRLEKLSEE
jgi:hypothetical protein